MSHTNVEIAEPMAIVGMSCRFAPDLDSPQKLWDFLADGRSAVGRMPDKRWEPYAAGSPRATAILRGTTRLGSFLNDIEGFDADFFGISPREADYLDPQQRIVLELAWEALADAGIAPLSLGGTEAGVYVSANSNDYGRRLLEDIPHTGAYAVNGTTYYGIANRVSYFLDLRGPSMAVDTACAGSLTALHLACAALQSGEVPVAIVGGVNIMATPALVVALDAAGATAPDGRSKAFDAAADGYGRGEGAGVVVLKRLSDARRDGDPVLAVIRGSGVFQDGRSDGMMAPNGEAQEHMLRRIYQRAGISPASVDYVEAHGTGTPVGDREEAQGLSQVFGASRPAGEPCLIGSLKPNIGHTEACSGVAGVIKSVLALRHGKIPPSIHTEPNPDFAWAESGLRLVGELTDWPATDSPRRAGVSSYGVGGTIAHLVLEEAPADVAEPVAPKGEISDTVRRPAVFPISAMSEAGLRAMAGVTADWVERNQDVPLASVGHTLALRRSHLAQRGAVVARSHEELAEGLRALAEGRRRPGVAAERAGSGAETGVVWVFSGHGAHWSGMGRELLHDEPEFAAVIDTLGPVFEEEMGWTPRAALERGGPWTASEAQALTFAVQAGLSAVWRRHGVVPAAVIGHSVGEIAAAVAAGVLELTEAARFACRRATALRAIEGQGGMIMAGLSFLEAELRLGERTDVVAAIAASPRSTVISGDREAVAALAAEWSGQGIEIRRVDSDIAFHSAHADAVVDEVAAAAGRMHPAPAPVTLYTTALEDARSLAPRDAAYWAANLRRPVRFAQAVDAAIEDGHRLFLEISAHPVVTHSITETLAHLGVEDALVVPSTRRDAAEVETLLGSLARLHCHGADVGWALEQPAGSLADLPPAAWQHRPYWIFPQAAGGSTGGGHDPQAHSLLGGRMTVSGSPARQVWQTHLDMTCRPYPQSHEVVNVEITPAAAIINTFVLAATRDGRVPGLTDVVLRTPLAVEPPRVVQVVLAENAIRLSSRVADDEAQDEESEWITHTTALVDAGRTPPQGTVDPEPIRARCADVWDWDRVDGLFRTKGVGGYAFPWGLDEIRTSGEEQLSILTLEPDAEHSGSWAHVVDGALTISAVLVTPEDADKLWMSSRMGSVSFRGEPPARITVHTVRNAISPIDTVDVLVADERGQIVCEVGGLRFAPLQDQAGTMSPPRELVHEVVWRELEPGTDNAVRSAVDEIVLVGEQSVTGPLAEQFGRAGVRCTAVATAEDLRDTVLPQDGAVLVAPSAALPGEDPAQAAERCSWTLIRTGQVLAEAYQVVWQETAPKTRLWALTRGVRAAGEESALAHAPLWGVARIIAGEHPELWGGLVDVDPEPAGDLGARLLPILRECAAQEDVISLAGDRAEVSRLSRIERAADGGAISCRPTGSYLITGGLGALGLLVARWLVDRGATRLLLASRRGLPPRTEWNTVRDARTRKQIDGVLALEALGVTVRVLTLDVSDPELTAEMLDPASHGLPPVRGILHAAGVTKDAMLDKVDQDGLRAVLGPKATGAMVLHRLFPPGSLDFFALFSSCGQFARLTGQISYAAANSFLDSLAAHRHASGHRETISLAWTAWEGVGMSEAIAGTMAEANGRGLASVSPAEAFRAWSFAERYQSPYLAVLKVLAVPGHVLRPPMFRELVAAEAAAGESRDDFAADLAALSDERLRELVAEDVREQVGAELNLAAADVEPRRPLVELGVDSVMTVALRVRLNRRYGVDLPPTILWSRPTVAALTAHLVETLRPHAAEDAGGPQPRAAA